MNFIVIVSDTFRRDHLGCYGNPWISTPHIDAFASNALVFDEAYSASFPTVPNRRDVLTGRFTASYAGWAPLAPDEVVLPDVLGKHGYTSMMVCDCPHILENGYHYDRGFTAFEWIRGQETDRWKTHPEKTREMCDPSKIRNPENLRQRHRRNIASRRSEADCFVARTMNTASEWLEHNYKRDKFLLYVDTFDPHEPWDAPQWYVDQYDPGYTGEVIDYPCYAYTDFLSDDELKHCKALYAAEVTLVDRWVGRLFEKIEDLGLLKNTTVIFTTDHGFLHGEHDIIGKALISPERFSYIPLYEEINHIPLIISFPNASPKRISAIVQPMDIMPTILELAGCPIPETAHGKSYAGALSGKKQKHRDFAVSAPYLKGAGVPATVVKDNFAAILYSSERNRNLVDKAVDGYEKKQMKELEIRDLLFDLSKSPNQEISISEEHPEIMSELRGDLIKFLKEIHTAEDIVKAWSVPYVTI
ncbi:sulfatase [Candidatus Sumerlaeota bacterium]|nr:sulfatase [Candidatus Sumerlaeota bacterium]